MKCPYCQFLEDRVLESRAIREGDAIKRRRECLHCTRRFTTYEHIEERTLMVVKRDGRREPFDRQKLLRGLELACRKRPIAVDRLSAIADGLEREALDRGEVEIPSIRLGERVMEILHGLDPVAYVRFASVYRDFQDVSQFNELLAGFRPEKRPRSVRNGRATAGRTAPGGNT